MHSAADPHVLSINSLEIMVSHMYQLHYQSIFCIKLSFELSALLEGGTTQNAKHLTLGSGHNHPWIIQCYFKDKIFEQSDSSIKEMLQTYSN